MSGKFSARARARVSRARTDDGGRHLSGLPMPVGPHPDGAGPDTPAHINRLAGAWLREFLRDLQDDLDARRHAP